MLTLPYNPMKEGCAMYFPMDGPENKQLPQRNK